MSRLVRLLSASSAITNLRPFGRLRDMRSLRSCRENDASLAPQGASTELPRFATPSFSTQLTSLPKRTAAVRPIASRVVPSPRSTVRVYRGSSGMTMVGKIDAICRMIDRCIADEHAAGLTPLDLNR